MSWGRYTWWEGTGGGDGGYFGTVRARLGYAIDRTLIYITGGLAYGGLNTNPLTGNTTSNVGWTIGGGVEYAFTNNWTAKIEGLYVDTGEESSTRTFTNLLASSFRSETTPRPPMAAAAAVSSASA